MKSLVLLAILCGIFAVLSLPTERPADLFALNPSVDTLDVVSCDNDEVISCVDATVNPDAINADQIMVEGVLWTKVQPLQDGVSDGSFSVEFSSPDGSTAVFTSRGGDMFGSVQMADGSVYLLENCGENCHVWMEMDTDLDEEGTDELDGYDVLDNRDDDNENRGTKWYTDLQNQGKEDETTIAEFSVMIYYTPEFAAETPDVRTYVDAVIAETNEGYINSKIPVRIKVHCIELAEDLHDMEDRLDMIYAFEDWGGNNIRRSADAAALLVSYFNRCGVGYTAGYRFDKTISVTKKSCALGHFSFGHEVGHNFGATHDKENGNNKYFPYGYGKHIGPQYLYDTPGFRTIMAYNAPGYGVRVNYFSNSRVPFKGYYTGSDEEDNARVIRENRFAMAAMGDESQTCTATTTEAPAPTTEAPPPTTEAPAPTTEAPAPTTEAPAPTTEAPAPTTEAPVPTTEAQAPTTEAPAPTTEAPALTTEAPAPTTEAPVPTTEATFDNNECKSGKMVVGQNIGKAKRAQDGFQCQQRCLNTKGCNWFVYFTSEFRAKKKRGKCFLKKNMKKMKKKKGVVSGAKACNDPSTILLAN